MLADMGVFLVTSSKCAMCENINFLNIKNYRNDVMHSHLISHARYLEAKKVLEYAYPRCKEILVAVPYCYAQGIEYGNIYEIHKQDDLTKENMLERYPCLEYLLGNEEYGYYVKKKEDNV